MCSTMGAVTPVPTDPGIRVSLDIGYGLSFFDPAAVRLSPTSVDEFRITSLMAHTTDLSEDEMCSRTTMTRAPKQTESAEHGVVYKSNDTFASWPFNGGMWRTEEGVVVAFLRHVCDYSVPEDLHDANVVRYGSVVSPVENRQNQLSHARIETYGKIASARTRDGGETWEQAGVISDNVETSETVLYDETPAMEQHDFRDPNVLLACWSAPNSAAANAVPWVKVSGDAGETWSDPTRLPTFNFRRIQGRPSYLVRPDGTLLLMLTGKRESDPHDVPIVYASFDGGENWSYLSQITQSEKYRTLCPSPVLLDDGRIVAAVRCKVSVDCEWTEVYESPDGGRSWSFVTRLNDLGAPTQLLRHGDALVAVYGYRHPPYGIRARVSTDGGASWSREWILRDDGANYDIGYPRAVRLDNGTILTAYYFNREDESVAVDGGPRYVASTRFDPNELLKET